MVRRLEERDRLLSLLIIRVMENNKEINENLNGCFGVGMGMAIILLACLILAFCSSGDPQAASPAHRIMVSE